MSKGMKIAISIILLVVLVRVVIMVVNGLKKNNNIKEINELLASETVQNELLTNIIEDSVNELNLGKNGEYRLKVQADNITDLLTKELLLDQSFVNNVEVETDSPEEMYMLTYEYNSNNMQLVIKIRGMYNDLDTKSITYQLSNKNNNIEFKKIDSKVISYSEENNNNNDREKLENNSTLNN